MEIRESFIYSAKFPNKCLLLPPPPPRPKKTRLTTVQLSDYLHGRTKHSSIAVICFLQIWEKKSFGNVNLKFEQTQFMYITKWKMYVFQPKYMQAYD